MCSTVYARGLLAGAAVLATLNTYAQHPAANLLNWRTAYPERSIDFAESDYADWPVDRTIPWLHAPNDSVLFVVRGGYGGRLLRTTDRGLSWQTPSDVPPPAGRLTFFSAQQGLVSYDSSASLPARLRGQIRLTTDGGTTWSAPRAVPTGQLHFTSPTQGYVFQPRLAGTLVVYTTTTAGHAWSVLDSLTGLPNIDFSWFAALPTANTAYLTGSREVQPDSFIGCVVQVRLGMGTWRLRTVPDVAVLPTLDPYAARAIRFTDDSTGAVVFNDGFASYHYSTTTGGRTWTARVLEYYDAGQMEVSVADAQHFLFHVWSYANQNLPLLSSSGTPFMASFPAPPVGPPSGPGGQFDFQEHMSRLILRPSGVGWAVGMRGRIYYTTDFGATFTLRTLLRDDSQPVDIGFPDPSHGWAAGYLNLIRTTDAGSTWARVTLPSPPNFSGNLRAAAFPDADTLVVATGNWPTAYINYLLSSRDAGQTWSSFAIPGNRPINDIRFAGGARRGVAVGDGGTILRTTDGGLTWQAAASGTTTTLSEVIWQDAQTLYALGGVVLKSTDGGASWQQVAGLFPPGTKQALFPTPQLGFVRTNTEIHRTTNGGASWQVVASSLSVLSNAPPDKKKFSFASPQYGWYNDYATQDSGRTWTLLPFVGTPAAVDADNSYMLLDHAGISGAYNSARVQRYSKHFLRTAPLANTSLSTSSTYSVAFATEGRFLPAEQDFRVELSNAMGRFRPGQTTTVGSGTASPVSIVIPASVALGSRYRLRVVRADGSVLGADNGQDLTVQRPTGTAPEADVLAAPRLYPNPAQHAVTVSFADGAQAGRLVRLLDLAGRWVLTVPAPGAEARLDLTGIAAGCYLVQVQTADGRARIQRLVVQP